MLEEKLRELAQSNRYPFHMPGHKRMLDGTNPYAIDITEIEDFDNLHHAEGIIKDAEDASCKNVWRKKSLLSCEWKYLWHTCLQSAHR